MSDELPLSTRTPIVDREEDFGDRPASQRFTHHARIAGEIAIAAPDGNKRVPFSVAVDRGRSILVFSFVPDGAAVVDRFDLEGKHQGVVARFAVGEKRGELKLPAGIAVDDQGGIYIPD